MLLRARTLLSVRAGPIDDGAVWIEDGCIQAAGHWPDVGRIAHGPAVDLGEVIVHPGWVNAHCHLDLTELAGQLAPPKSFSGWIKSLLTAKSDWSFSEFALSWLKGAEQLVRSGTTTVANIESVPEMLADVRACTPLRVWSLLELTGVRRQRDPAQLLQAALEILDRLPIRRGGVGLSPHAPYSTPPALLGLAAEAARQRHWPITTHIAESTEEFEMFVRRTGPMYDWLAAQRSMDDCGLGSPLAHCSRHGLLSPSLLIAHANLLWRNDVEILARSGASVVHCPQSHDYFRHPRFPLPELIAAGINVCLGTDSLASTRKLGRRRPTLSMTDEFRSFNSHNTGLSPAETLTLATRNGARAVGVAGSAGELSPGAWADLAVIPYSGPLAAAEEATMDHHGDVLATLIDGRWEWQAPGYDLPRPIGH